MTRENWVGLIRIARPDHWFKNIFVLPGILLVFFFDPGYWVRMPWGHLVWALVLTCLTASSNYVINEILDAGTDRFHPEKRNRPIPSGQVRVGQAWLLFGVLAVAGVGGGFLLSRAFGLTAMALWVAGLLYNVPPIRLKDVPYGDVLSESVNNPIRMALGWYATEHAAAPVLSVMLAYWMFGGFLMAAKRLAEYRNLGDARVAAAYRKSFGYYNEERLLETIVFYAALFAMFSGVFMARYRLELVLATPLVAYSMAYYLHLAFKPDSPVQKPESLYRAWKLVALVAAAFVACWVLLFWDLPIVGRLLSPAFPLR